MSRATVFCTFFFVLEMRVGLSQEVFTSCFDDSNMFLTYVTQPLTFEAAKADCESRNATLARISNQNEFNFARDLMESTGLMAIDAWIGNR